MPLVRHSGGTCRGYLSIICVIVAELLSVKWRCGLAPKVVAVAMVDTVVIVR